VDPDKETRLWYRQPARGWLEALPLGNGSFGAMLWGDPQRERVDLNIDTLWSGGPRMAHTEKPEALLAELRAAVIERHDYAKADALVRGLQGPFNEAYQPLGWLTVAFDGISGPHNYERSLDLSEGVAAVRYEVGDSVYEREAFVSTLDRALIIHLSVRGPKRLNLEIAFGSQHPSVSSYDDEGTLWLEGRAPAHVVPHYWQEEPAVVYSEHSGLRFVAGAGLNVRGGALERAGSGSLPVEGADELTLFVSAATGYTAYDLAPVEDPVILRNICRTVLLHPHSEPYPLVRARHADGHKALFNRCSLQLESAGAVKSPTDERLQALRDGNADEGLFALLFHYGRYLLISSSRPGSQPANLQGIWNDQVRPPWSSNWTTNINTQMNYWPAETTNLAECHEPLMALITDLSRAGESTAKDIYSCRGWAAHHNVDIWRSTWRPFLFICSGLVPDRREPWGLCCNRRNAAAKPHRHHRPFARIASGLARRESLRPPSPRGFNGKHKLGGGPHEGSTPLSSGRAGGQATLRHPPSSCWRSTGGRQSCAHRRAGSDHPPG
jgi:alpha-L-fucosidase 2